MTGKNFTSFPVLKTGRLTLRQLRSNDDKEVFALRSNSNVNKYLDRKPGKSIDDAQKFITTVNGNIQRNDSIYWAITMSGIDIVIGTICLFDFSEDHSKVEMGYELLPEFQGKGIMQEAILEVTRFAFQDVELNSIEAYTHPENKSSIRLLEKLNFKRDNAAEKNIILFKLKSNDEKTVL